MYIWTKVYMYVYVKERLISLYTYSCLHKMFFFENKNYEQKNFVLVGYYYLTYVYIHSSIHKFLIERCVYIDKLGIDVCIHM